jgi:hypothetical protein
MNLVLGILWLLGAIGVFGYEAATGKALGRIRGFDISTGWFLLILAAWNFVRWYSARAGKANQEAMRIVHEARLRQARTRERPLEPDPTFDFTAKPTNISPTPPSPTETTDRPPANN